MSLTSATCIMFRGRKNAKKNSRMQKQRLMASIQHELGTKSKSRTITDPFSTVRDGIRKQVSSQHAFGGARSVSRVSRVSRVSSVSSVSKGVDVLGVSSKSTRGSDSVQRMSKPSAMSEGMRFGTSQFGSGMGGGGRIISSGMSKDVVSLQAFLESSSPYLLLIHDNEDRLVPLMQQLTKVMRSSKICRDLDIRILNLLDNNIIVPDVMCTDDLPDVYLLPFLSPSCSHRKSGERVIANFQVLEMLVSLPRVYPLVSPKDVRIDFNKIAIHKKAQKFTNSLVRFPNHVVVQSIKSLKHAVVHLMNESWFSTNSERSVYIKPVCGGMGSGVHRISVAKPLVSASMLSKGLTMVQKGHDVIIDNEKYTFRAEFVGSEFVYLILIRSSVQQVNLCPCNIGKTSDTASVKMEIVVDPTRFITPEHWDAFLGFAKSISSGIAFGIEFSYQRDTPIYVFDINYSTSYNDGIETSSANVLHTTATNRTAKYIVELISNEICGFEETKSDPSSKTGTSVERDSDSDDAPDIRDRKMKHQSDTKIKRTNVKEIKKQVMTRKQRTSKGETKEGYKQHKLKEATIGGHEKTKEIHQEHKDDISIASSKVSTAVCVPEFDIRSKPDAEDVFGIYDAEPRSDKEECEEKCEKEDAEKSKKPAVSGELQPSMDIMTMLERLN